MTCPSLLCRRSAAGDLVGVLAARVRAEDTLGQFCRFILVGGATTLVYAALYVALRDLGYLPAHLLATAASTALANEMHRRLTFRAEERVHWFTAQWEAGGITVLGLVGTSTALGLLDSMTGTAPVLAQVALAVAVTALIGLMRFVALRWIFRSPVADPA
ncbi:GtrA family protein [Geodermatophilus ruber]|uniref:Putative flippase GtrA (Transmembrane translocase of bactoprenol-linked glucose) n=1 Tax=Geodermatophilus ruber TaxID=504800 RepID=A0A1I3Z077_9ACTN|nr:GtrA family protein [Geodermatophilus ruber]SFK37512.1 Putative flippase GtrA (transmembrane translocase of bactoprenol-linked glucose) [Geodermatophilus ruber]